MIGSLYIGISVIKTIINMFCWGLCESFLSLICLLFDFLRDEVMMEL